MNKDIANLISLTKKQRKDRKDMKDGFCTLFERCHDAYNGLEIVHDAYGKGNIEIASDGQNIHFVGCFDNRKEDLINIRFYEIGRYAVYASCFNSLDYTKHDEIIDCINGCLSGYIDLDAYKDALNDK